MDLRQPTARRTNNRISHVSTKEMLAGNMENQAIAILEGRKAVCKILVVCKEERAAGIRRKKAS